MDFQQFLRTSHLEIFILPTTHGKVVLEDIEGDKLYSGSE